MGKDLNAIKINLADLRRDIAQLQKDGYEEIGLEDLLRYIHATTRKPIPTTDSSFQKGGGKA